MKVARPIAALIESFQKLPGVGPKSAQRLTYYLLHVPQNELDDFSDNISKLKKIITKAPIIGPITAPTTLEKLINPEDLPEFFLGICKAASI